MSQGEEYQQLVLIGPKTYVGRDDEEPTASAARLNAYTNYN